MTIGNLIVTIHEYFMSLYDDEEIATVATAAMINEIMMQQATTKKSAA